MLTFAVGFEALKLGTQSFDILALSLRCFSSSSIPYILFATILIRILSSHEQILIEAQRLVYLLKFTQIINKKKERKRKIQKNKTDRKIEIEK